MSILEKRMAWVGGMHKGLVWALGEDVISAPFELQQSTDPLKVILKIPFSLPISGKSRAPFRTYLRCWAEDSNCEVPIINITNKYAQAEVLIKDRHWTKEHYGRQTKARRRSG